eukprot:Skav206107  [mRNA]  locus=scaffold3597:155671:156456:+ [translate_table: standard]
MHHSRLSVELQDLKLGSDCMNLLSAATSASDRVLTVSPKYAELPAELPELPSPEEGEGLREILQHKLPEMASILNDIPPVTDESSGKIDLHIPPTCRIYSLRNFEEGKALCKKELQKSLGLQEDPGVALLGFSDRLCNPNGVHLITQILSWLLTYEPSGVLGKVQVILMGGKDQSYASQIFNAEHYNKGRVCGYVGFDEEIQQRMLAGCDFFMMPSEHEPCGLQQMYAEPYGTVPVVQDTVGKDFVSGLWDEQRDRETATA